MYFRWLWGGWGSKFFRRGIRVYNSVFCCLSGGWGEGGFYVIRKVFFIK